MRAAPAALELVHDAPLQERGAHSRSRRIDQLYREWSRNRADLERLQQLHEAIGEVLEESTTGVR